MAADPESAPEAGVNELGEEVNEGIHQQGTEVFPEKDSGPPHLWMSSAAQMRRTIQTVWEH